MEVLTEYVGGSKKHQLFRGSLVLISRVTAGVVAMNKFAVTQLTHDLNLRPSI